MTRRLATNLLGDVVAGVSAAYAVVGSGLEAFSGLVVFAIVGTAVFLDAIGFTPADLR